MTRLEQAKQKDLIKVLAGLGYTATPKAGSLTWYKSMLPGRYESDPSFCVFRDNTWKDFGSDLKRGDVIDFVCAYKGISISEAIDFLLEGEISREPDFVPPPPRDKPSVIIKATREISSDQVYDYLNDRCISPHRARPYIKEMDIVFPYGKYPEKEYLMVGHYTDARGIEMRSKAFKTISLSPKGITTYRGTSSAYAIFEGIFDFLSYLEYFNIDELKHTCIILNGVSFIGGVAPFLKEKEVHCFSDNDKAGDQVYHTLVSEGCLVIDERHYYKGYKDFNDFLVNN
ncbi:MAG: toprim domain-containing protein [Anaerovoracaceae bacterium]